LPDRSKLTKRRSLLAALGATMLLAPPGARLLAQASRPAPDRAAGLQDSPPLAALDGSPLLLQRYLGVPLLINLWASWCAPCIAEMPALAALRKAQGAEGHGRIEVLALNAGQSINQVEQFLEERPLALPIALDPRKLAIARWQVRLLPTSLLFCASGDLIARWAGERDWNSPAMIAEIDRALATGTGVAPSGRRPRVHRAGS
jgi:thiol-disulfide isomerase/thioredoxin